MKSLKKTFPLLLLVVLFLAIAPRVDAAESEVRKWDSLLDVAHKFSWYPRADLQNLLDVKTAEYGQSLEEYRASLMAELTGGRAVRAKIRTDDFISGRPWRDYYRLSMADFCLFLTTDEVAHLQNARSALRVLVHKTEQPEIEFWHYVYGAHSASLAKDREAFVNQMYRLWQNVIIRFEVEAQNFASPSAQVGFGRDLPHLYENLVHLLIRKAILEQEIPELYALNVMLLDIQPKLTVENGYKVMAEQVVERMRGPGSDNKNVNFAVAWLEATAKRYAFEDEKDEAELAAKFNLARKYYHLADSWADTGKGNAAIMTEYVGFMNYTIRRFSDPADPLSSNPSFQNLPAMASNQMEAAFGTFDRMAAHTVADSSGLAEGFEDREAYLQAMHQLMDATAKLAIVLSDYHAGKGEPGQPANSYAAASPLERYCTIFDRYARTNAEVLPDNAYFLAAYAASELGGFYREQTRFSTDSRTDALAFAYQMQAIEIFPLDLPAVLQMAFQSSLSGQVRTYFQRTRPITTHLRVSNASAEWTSRNPTDFNQMIGLMPKVVPDVIDNAFVLLAHFPEEQTSEDALFARAVAMAKVLGGGQTATSEQTEQILAEIGRGNFAVDARTAPADDDAFPFFALKSELYAAPDSPVHGYLRALYNEIPFENRQYVALLGQLR